MHMAIEITGSNFMEKKLFSHIDSAVVKAYKFKNKVAIEADFPCIAAI